MVRSSFRETFGPTVSANSTFALFGAHYEGMLLQLVDGHPLSRVNFQSLAEKLNKFRAELVARQEVEDLDFTRLT